MKLNIVNRLLAFLGLDYLVGVFVSGRVGYFGAYVTLITAHILSFGVTCYILQYNTIIGFSVAISLWVLFIYLIRRYIGYRLRNSEERRKSLS